MTNEKPDIIQMDIRCEGEISEEMQETIDAIESDLSQALLKHGYKDIEFEWEN